MNDLIKREDAIKAMKILEAEDNKTYGCSIPECFDSDKAIKALNELPSAELEELKAQKPETRAKVRRGWGFAMCESCKKRVYENDIYCSHCGAKLEWE